jgi:PAT family beta-lactamase induction signal transducer AmpG
VQSLALVPFILKFLVGPLSDRVSFFGLGHRKPYILVGLALQCLGLVGLSLVNAAGRLTVFTVLAVLTVTGLALYDTCCDGMVVDVTPPSDRGRVQGTLMAARFLAATVSSFLIGAWLGRPQALPGPSTAQVLWACAGLGVLPFAVGLWVHEPVRSAAAEQFQWAALAVLLRPRSLALLGFGTLYAMVTLGVEQNLPPYYFGVLGIDAGGVGSLGALRNVGRALGGVCLAVFLPRLGRKGALVMAVAGVAGAAAGQAGALGFGSAALLGLVFGIANGWADALFFVLAMEASDPRMAASTYALFMAVTNLSVVGGSLVSLGVERFGSYWSAFALAGAVALFNLLLVPVLSRPMSRPETRDVVADT